MSFYPLRAFAALAAVLLLTAPVFADEKHQNMTIDIEGEDGESISLTLSSNLVDGIIEGLSDDIDCDGSDLDSDTRAMLEHLDREGKGSRYSYTNEEGELVKARRHKGQWEMEIVKEGENNTFISMPWAMAECMLGRDVPAYRGKDKLEFKVEQDGGVRIRIE